MGCDAKMEKFLHRAETFRLLSRLRRISNKEDKLLCHWVGVTEGEMHSGMLKTFPEQIFPEVIIGKEDNFESYCQWSFQQMLKDKKILMTEPKKCKKLRVKENCKNLRVKKIAKISKRWTACELSAAVEHQWPVWPERDQSQELLKKLLDLHLKELTFAKLSLNNPKKDITIARKNSQ